MAAYPDPDSLTPILVACACLETRHQETLDAVASTLSSRLPDGHQRMTLANYRTHPAPVDEADHDALAAKRAVQTMLRVDCTGLLTLCGDVGRGKTHLAIGAYLWLRDRKRLVPVYVNFADLLERRRQSFGLTGDDALEAHRQWQAIRLCRFLVVDDLGAELDTEWAAETRYKLIAQRYESRLSTGTIVTTNVLPAALGGRVSSRLLSREDGVRLVVMRGPDVRLQAAPHE